MFLPSISLRTQSIIIVLSSPPITVVAISSPPTAVVVVVSPPIVITPVPGAPASVGVIGLPGAPHTKGRAVPDLTMDGHQK